MVIGDAESIVIPQYIFKEDTNTEWKMFNLTVRKAFERTVKVVFPFHCKFPE
jgi:hypothetical protein